MERIKYAVLFSMLILAVVMDMRRYRVKNQLIGAGMAAGLCIRLLESGMPGIIQWAAGIALPFVLLFGLYYISALGAGDIKLFSAIGAILGPCALIKLITASFVLAAMMSMILMIYRKNFRQRFQNLISFLQRHYMKLLNRQLSDTEKITYMDFSKKDCSACIHFTVPVFAASVILYIFNVTGRYYFI